MLCHRCILFGLISAVLAGLSPAMALEITDQRGQKLIFNRQPQRVVTMPQPTASIYVVIDGKADRLVAMNPGSLSAIKGEWLATLFPALTRLRTDIVRGGQFAPNIETLLSLKPDVVFQWADQGPELTAPLERAGIRVFGEYYGNQAKLEKTISAVGQLTGQEVKVAELLAKHHSVMAKLKARTNALPVGARPKVLYLQRFTHSLRPNGRGSYTDMYIHLAGGKNAAVGVGGTGTDVTFEQVLSWAPEVILLGTFDQAVPADLYKNPKWASVPAVRDKRVYKMPVGGYRWDPPNIESPLAWIWLARILHPNKSDISLKTEMASLYTLIYGHAPTPAEADSILKVGANLDSRDYAHVIGR